MLQKIWDHRLVLEPEIGFELHLGGFSPTEPVLDTMPKAQSPTQECDSTDRLLWDSGHPGHFGMDLGIRKL